MGLPFPWLTAAHIRNEYPQVSEAKIEAAARDVSEILSDLKPDAKGDFSCTADQLIESLRRLGHNRAAAAWAVFQGIQEEVLRVKLTHAMSPEFAQSLMGDSQHCVVPKSIPLDRIYELKHVTVVSTDALWQWVEERGVKESTSPLTEYTTFLTLTCQDLINWSKRDEEAIRLLTDDASRELQEKTGGYDHLLSEESRQHTHSPRIWTRRDKRHLDFRAGKDTGYLPIRRTGRYLHHLHKRESAHFRAALNEARHDGIAPILAPKLELVHQAFAKLYEVAWYFTKDDFPAQEVSDEAFRMASKVTELIDYLKTPISPHASHRPVIVQIPTPETQSLVAGSVQSTTESVAGKNKSPLRKPKVKHKQTDSEVKLVAALSRHHQYENGSIGEATPVGCRELGRLAEVSEKAASGFFKKSFGNHKRYTVICRQPEKLIASLKALNYEFTPKDFANARTPDDLDREAETREWE